MYYSNDYLCHYGVLGMKWGQHLFGKTGAAQAGRKRASKKDRATAIASRTLGSAVGGFFGGIGGSIIGDSAMMAVGLGSISAATITTGGAALGAAIGLGLASKRINKAYERLKTSDKYDTMSKALTSVDASRQRSWDKKIYSIQNASRFATNNSKLAEQAMNKLTDDEYYAIYKTAYQRGSSSNH